MLIDNINILRTLDRSLLNELQKVNCDLSPYNIEVAKSGEKTLVVPFENKNLYLHSKYDPINEAKRLQSQYDNKINNYQYVLFYGLGLGYHVDQFVKKYPDMQYMFCEPKLDLLYQFLSEYNLKEIKPSKLKGFINGQNPHSFKNSLSQLISTMDGNILLVILPSYERIFYEETQLFKKLFKELLESTKSALVTNVSYEKRWTINSIKNLPYILDTPNIIHDLDKTFFRKKPAILVSAGPSLEEEMENLKYIKENGLAYIFSAGSAINPLLNNGILPDAACTYDPQVTNQRVFKRLVEEKIDSIPLFFGSSVGYETVKNYSGPKYHMITNQDTISPYYCKLNQEKHLKVVNDAPSIAVVTLQLLLYLEFDPIILVGQNLAYKGESSYATGSKYDEKLTIVNESQKKNSIEVDDVHGNKVKTNETFNLMREQLELYINSFQGSRKFINSSKGGAAIRGTTYIELEEIIQEELNNNVVDESWRHRKKLAYDTSYSIQKCKEMEKYIEEYSVTIDKLAIMILEMSNMVKSNNEQKLINSYPKFDKLFKKVQNSKFFQVYLKPMNRVQYDSLKNKFANHIRPKQDIIQKTKLMLNEVNKFILILKRDMDIMIPEIKEIHTQLINRSDRSE